VDFVCSGEGWEHLCSPGILSGGEGRGLVPGVDEVEVAGGRVSEG